MAVERWSERIWIDRLPEEPALGDELDHLNGLLEDRFPGPDIILDLSGLSIIHSTNLSRLLRLRKTVLSHNARMRLAGPCDALWSVFLTAGLDRLFEFTPDTATSLAQLQVSAG